MLDIKNMSSQKPYSIWDKEKQARDAKDPKVIDKVYENQNGTCQQCLKSVAVIVRVKNTKTGEVGYIGLCDNHSYNLGVGTKIIGTKVS